MKTFVEYYHDENGQFCKRRRHYGDSTEAKPANGETADSFHEIDTAKYFLYNGRTAEWVEQ